MFLEFVRKLLGMLSSSGSTTSSTVVSNGASGSPPIAEEATPPIVEDSVNLSQKGLDWLKQVERLALKPYDDQTGKATHVWVKGATIGYGHLIAKAEWDTYKGGITEAGANALLDTDLQPFEAAVNSTIKAKLSQNQFDALVILTFNIGAANLARSSVAKMVNDPTAQTMYKTLEAAWKSWNKSQGKVMLGLERQRQCEWNVYSLGKYEKNW